MAIPSPTKTWQFKINQQLISPGVTPTWPSMSPGVIAGDIQSVLYAIKVSLTTFGSTPWTVVSSSDSASAGATDYWTAASKLVWHNNTANARSWIVLQQTGMSATFQILIDCIMNGTGQNGAQVAMFWSAAGFTGGSTTARPTATDQVQVLTSAQYWLRDNNSVSPLPLVLHVMQSTDGQCTRIFGCRGTDGQPDFGWLFERIKNASGSWTTPYIVMVNPGDWSNSRGYMGWLSTSGSPRFTSKNGATNMALYATSEGFANNFFYLQATTLQRRNQLSNEWQLFPIGVACETTGAIGHHGMFYDMWFCNYIGYATTFADDDSKTWWACDDLVIPWDGSSQVLLGL